MVKSVVVAGFGILSAEEMGFTAPLGEATRRRSQFTLTIRSPHSGAPLLITPGGRAQEVQ